VHGLGLGHGNGNNNGYLQGEVDYDDLMSNNPASWTGNGDQYAYQPQAQTQDSYPQYGSNQQHSFDHYDLSQPAQYQQPASFAHSPYSSQYQHPRSSDVFSQTSYVEPSLQSSAAPYQTSFSFAPQESATISPHSLQYHNQNISASQPVNRGLSNAPQYQHSTNNYSQRPQEQESAYFSSAQNNNMHSTVAPGSYTLPNGSSDPPKQSLKPPAEKSFAPPVSYSITNSLRITHPDLLEATNTSTRPPLEYAQFMRWTDEPLQVAPGLKNTIPKYHPRKSKSGKELVPGFDVLSKSCSPHPSPLHRWIIRFDCLTV